MTTVPANNNFIDDTPHQVPMQVVAQWGAVTVYQTAAFFSNGEASGQSAQLEKEQAGQTSYGELNLGLHVDDNAEQVLSNRMRLLSAINVQLNDKSSAESHTAIKRLHWVSQVHGKQIYDTDTALDMRPLSADAMISQHRNVGLAIMTADCVPIVLYQPATGKIAAIHAGWQGLACGVIKATAERFDDSPMTAWIGVCISQANYEVDRSVAARLLIGCTKNQLLNKDDTDNFEPLFCRASSDSDDASANADKLKLDLPKLAAVQLKTLNIAVANQLPVECSYANDRYYSYRRQTHLQQSATGRMALIIVRSGPIDS